MPVELKMLGWSTALGLIYLLLATLLSLLQRGMAWNTGNRDEAVPLTGMAARMDRASRNFLETFAFFAVAVLVVVVGQRTGARTVLGAELYFWARVVYLPVYAAGIPYLRTLVWTVSVVGLVMVLSGVFSPS
ncbi:MAPEG family protein [Rhodanobacter sp. 7MK24]|uniref:MAPEG family protein n=1 Tax=Rhodanobacter sp. 7MK24 TaxID=2775922 RepID=UPI001784D8E2|nr:MAPEG family protein [Rhodanobacter sp. 7MK24]MBD8879552.1 MAPEG family protein [Rhodanobacter sp. 7MK24]